MDGDDCQRMRISEVMDRYEMQSESAIRQIMGWTNSNDGMLYNDILYRRNASHCRWKCLEKSTEKIEKPLSFQGKNHLTLYVPYATMSGRMEDIGLFFYAKNR